MAIDRSIELSAYPGASSQTQTPPTTDTPAPTTATPDEKRGARWPFIACIVLGLVLTVTPIAGGFFYPAAQAGAMITDFAPYTESTKLQQFRTDLATLESVRGGVIAIDRAGAVDAESYPGLRTFVERYPGIHRDMAAMINQFDSARGDYQRLAAIRSISGIPFIPVAAGLALIGLGGWGLRRRRASSTRRVGAAVIVVGLALASSPFALNLVGNANAGEPLLNSLRPVMTEQKVREVQGYFVVLVGAVGDIDSRYLPAAQASTKAPDVAVASVRALNQRWQPMSSDFAGLIGVMNDNLVNVAGVATLDNRTRPMGFGAFSALPWFLLGAGVVGAGLGVAAYLTSRKAPPA